MMMPLKADDVQPKVGGRFDKQEFASRRGRHLSPVDDRLSCPNEQDGKPLRRY